MMPKCCRVPSVPLQIKQWGLHHSKERQKLWGLNLSNLNLTKIWHMQTLFKGVSGHSTGGPPLWQSGALWGPRGECFASGNGVFTIRKSVKNHLGHSSWAEERWCEALSSPPETILIGIMRWCELHIGIWRENDWKTLFFESRENWQEHPWGIGNMF